MPGTCGSIAAGFWPATVFFPIEMWIRVFKPRPGLKAFLRFINIISFLITLATVIGSVELIIVSWTDFQIFQVKRGCWSSVGAVQHDVCIAGRVGSCIWHPVHGQVPGSVRSLIQVGKLMASVLVADSQSLAQLPQN
jgi:hypothetical protein